MISENKPGLALAPAFFIFPSLGFASSSVLRGLMFIAVTLALVPARLWSADAPVAVFTQTFNGYQRARLPDHSFKAETYAFGEGGTGGLDKPRAGKSELTFMRVARAAALPLAKANYVPSSNPNETALLISVFWGRTLGSVGAAHSFLASGYNGAYGANRSSFGTPLGVRDSFGSAEKGGESPKAEDSGLHGKGAQNGIFNPNVAAMNALCDQADIDNPIRDRIDNSNARIVGYSQALFRARHDPINFVSRDLVREVAENRYYIVLQAYDFRLAWKEKKLKLLWEARISIEEDDNDFDESIESMLAAARPVFGQDSDGLQRRFVPGGHVTIGPLKEIESLPPTK